MPIEAGATYVFDLGYYDYAWWAKLAAAQCRIVTRFKANTPLSVREERAVAAGRQHPVRSHRLSAASPGHEPAQPDGRSGARGAGHDRHRQGAAHPLQRSRRLVPRRSPSSTSAAGPSSCSSAGSSRPSRSPASSAPPRMPCTSRSLSPSSPFCCCGWRRNCRAPSAARWPFARLVKTNIMHLRRLDQLDRPPLKALECPDQGALWMT